MELSAELDEVLRAYVEATEIGDRVSAAGVVTEALVGGFTAELLIEGVIARGQALVGTGWLQGRWTVATEHRATGIAEFALAALADTARRTPGAPADGAVGRAVVACSEGEWHTLPGRMVSEVLRLRGIDVTFIGPSVPAEDLAALVGQDVPPVVAVSCSMPLSLTGAWRTLTALRGIGVYVVCGGRGFGSDGRWGLALGADAWAPGLVTGADLVTERLGGSRPAPRPPAGAQQAISELAILNRLEDSVVSLALSLAVDLRPGLRDAGEGAGQMRRELSWNYAALRSAVIADDVDVLREHAHWLELLLESRNLPVRYVPTALDVLRRGLPEEVPTAHRMLAESIESCREPPARSFDELLG